MIVYALYHTHCSQLLLSEAKALLQLLLFLASSSALVDKGAASKRGKNPWSRASFLFISQLLLYLCLSFCHDCKLQLMAMAANYNTPNQSNHHCYYNVYQLKQDSIYHVFRWIDFDCYLCNQIAPTQRHLLQTRHDHRIGHQHTPNAIEITHSAVRSTSSIWPN